MSLQDAIDASSWHQHLKRTWRVHVSINQINEMELIANIDSGLVVHRRSNCRRSKNLPGCNKLHYLLLKLSQTAYDISASTLKRILLSTRQPSDAIKPLLYPARSLKSTSVTLYPFRLFFKTREKANEQRVVFSDVFSGGVRLSEASGTGASTTDWIGV
jgi:hypothetical protein